MRSERVTPGRIPRALTLAGLVGVLVPAHVPATPADGLRLAAELRCAEALPLLQGGEGLEVSRARALCRLQEGEYAAAAEELAALESSEPGLAADLGIALFHLGDLTGAEAALRRAERAGTSRADLPLYLGLISLQRDQAAASLASFARAGELSPADAGPAAGYYAAVARTRLGDEREARIVLERVIAEWPSTVWAEEAQRLLAALEASSPYFASVRLGIEHDTNAVLRGAGVVLPEEIPSQEDQRFVGRAIVGRSWTPARDIQLGGALAFGASVHGDLQRFDALHPSLSIWASRRLGEAITLRGAGSYGHAWVDEREFLSAPAVAIELYRDAASGGVSRAFAELTFDDFRFACPDPIPALCRARDRDGLGVRVGLEHRAELPRLGAALSAGIAYRGFSADGTEYSFDSAELELGWESQLPQRLVVTAWARYGYRPYRNPSTYELPSRPERTEHDWRTDLSVQRPIWRQLTLEASWRYQRNRSTVDVFDYRRHIVGLYASWTQTP